jgi:hypothetical protein
LHQYYSIFILNLPADQPGGEQAISQELLFKLATWYATGFHFWQSPVHTSPKLQSDKITSGHLSIKKLLAMHRCLVPVLLPDQRQMFTKAQPRLYNAHSELNTTTIYPLRRIWWPICPVCEYRPLKSYLPLTAQAFNRARQNSHGKCECKRL